jgi:hypothetical protein
MILHMSTLPQFFACPMQETGFPMPYVLVFFVFNCLSLEVVVCFVHIGGIVDQQY